MKTQLLKDYLLVNEVLKLNPTPYKQAGFMSDAASWITNYIDQQIDKRSTTTIIASVVPLVLSTALAFISGPFGIILPILTGIFDLEIKDLIIKILGGLEPELKKLDESKGEYDISEDHIRQIVKEAVDPITTKDGEQVKMANLNDNLNLLLIKQAFWGTAAKAAAPAAKSFIWRALTFIFNFIIKTIKGTSFYAVGDAANVPLHRPSTFNETKVDGQPAGEFAQPAVKQTKYKLKKFVDTIPKSITMPNSFSSIENLLVNIVQEVYDGLDSKDSLIKATPSLNVLAKEIAKYNELSKGMNLVVMPKALSSKKAIADMIIDDVAGV